MARRFQSGSVSRMGSWYVVRYREDIGDERRQTYQRICPASGPGRLSKAQRNRRAEEILKDQGVNSVEKFHAQHGETFRTRAAGFLDEARKRKRKPVKRATLATWESCLEKYLNPEIGEEPLANINNGTLKRLVARLDSFGLSAKTIINYTGFMKLVVSSAVDENTGEPLYPRKWNHTFADMPIVHNQKQPTFSEEAMSSIAERSRGTYQVLFTLLAATGMRIGEALGLDIENIYLEDRIIKIAASAWHSELQTPKTRAALREIDVTESVVNLLQEFIGDRKSGLLFKTKSGKPLGQSNVIRRHLHPLVKNLEVPRTGFHAFRRFRTTWLRKQGALEDLVKLWLGHAETSITDGYSKIKTDAAFRRQEAERVGIGFEIAQSISPSVRNVRKSEQAIAA